MTDEAILLYFVTLPKWSASKTLLGYEAEPFI